ncbi:STAS domain-containing protein [Aliikangiella sp. IMCC44359]|uniref:STAS domain-containing protein n=1 Tax=Aliikangiella sp. IMCC44359 TaxID=3459125 RepID=UPI00403B316E
MEKKTTVSLGTAVDITHAANLKSRLTTALNKKLPVVLISNNVERADTAGLQLIYTFIQKAEAQGSQVSWQKPSDAIVQASEILGMSEPLNLG